MQLKQTTEVHTRFHIVTDFVDGTSVSTILLYDDPIGIYETCIFYPNGDSDVERRYETEAKARKGHAEIVASILTPITE